MVPAAIKERLKTTLRNRDQSVDDWFEELDKDKSGSLDIDELRAGVEKLDIGLKLFPRRQKAAG